MTEFNNERVATVLAKHGPCSREKLIELSGLTPRQASAVISVDLRKRRLHWVNDRLEFTAHGRYYYGVSFLDAS